MRSLLALLGICVLGLVLRFVGIDHLLPHKSEPDGQIVHLSQDHEDGPFRGKYPFLPIVLNDLVPGGAPAELPRSADLEQHLTEASAPFAKGRRFMTLLAFLLVPGTFVLARRFFPAPWALLSTALVALSPLLLCYSVQARPHALVAAASLWAVIAAVRMSREGTWAWCIISALATAFAVSCLHTGAGVLAAYGMAGIVAARRFGRASLLRLLAATLLIIPAATWAYWPAEVDPLREGGRQSQVLEEQGFSESWRGAGVRGSMRLRASETKPPGEGGDAEEPSRAVWTLGKHQIYLDFFGVHGFGVFVRALRSYDPVLLLLGAGGLLLLLGRTMKRSKGDRPPRASHMRADLLIVCAHALPVLLVLGAYGGVKERFFMPLLPYIALVGTLAVIFCARMLGRLLPRSLPCIIPSAIVSALFLAWPLVTSLRMCVVRSRPDTYTQAASWMRENVKPRRSTITLANMTDVPVRQGNLYGTWLRRAAVSWRNYQRAVFTQETPIPAYKLHYPNKLNMSKVLNAPSPQQEYEALLAKWDPDYTLISPEGVGVEAYQDDILPEAARSAVLARGGELVATFSPFVDPDQTGRGFEYFFGIHATSKLWEIQSLGPLIEVYKYK